MDETIRSVTHQHLAVSTMPCGNVISGTWKPHFHFVLAQSALADAETLQCRSGFTQFQ